MQKCESRIQIAKWRWDHNVAKCMRRTLFSRRCSMKRLVSGVWCLQQIDQMDRQNKLQT